MEIGTLQAQIRASRQAAAESDGVKFTLELPSDHAWRMAMETNRDEAGLLLHSQAAHAVLSRAITGWQGLTARHLLLEADADPLPFSPAVRGELLDARQDMADELMAFVGEKIAERREKRDAARKNLSGASSGTSTESQPPRS